jgi:hypothetical protein
MLMNIEAVMLMVNGDEAETIYYSSLCNTGLIRVSFCFAVSAWWNVVAVVGRKDLEEEKEKKLLLLGNRKGGLVDNV